VIQALRKQRNEATAEYAALNVRYGPNHPLIVQSLRAISDIDAQIDAEVRRVRASLAADALVAERRTASVQSDLDRANDQLKAAKTASVFESQLQNKADADQAVYQSFLDRYKQTSAETGMERPDSRIISLATIPTQPSSLSRGMIVMAGLLAGCVAGLIAVALVELILDGIYGPDQLVQRFHLPCLGVVPELGAGGSQGKDEAAQARQKVIDAPLQANASTFSELLRGIVAAEPYDVNMYRHKLVMMTSSVAAEGKSSTSIALARTLALQGVRVLLIDCDLGRYTMTRMLGGVTTGVVELVNGWTTIERAIQTDEQSGMKWIGIREASGVAGAFAKQSVPDLMRTLREQFDIVLVDAPPVLATADARSIARIADHVVVAVRWANTRRANVQATLNLLHELSANVTGMILTRVDLRKQARMGDVGSYAYHVHYEAYQN
jgi:capsular exopolysaccharide synthesis family protein